MLSSFWHTDHNFISPHSFPIPESYFLMLAARQKVNFASQHQSSQRQRLCHSTDSIFPSRGWVIWEIWPAAGILTAFHLLFHGTIRSGGWCVGGALAAPWLISDSGQEAAKTSSSSFFSSTFSFSVNPHPSHFDQVPASSVSTFCCQWQPTPPTILPSARASVHSALHHVHLSSIKVLQVHPQHLQKGQAFKSNVYRSASNVSSTATFAIFAFSHPFPFPFACLPRNLVWNNLNLDRSNYLARVCHLVIFA